MPATADPITGLPGARGAIPGIIQPGGPATAFGTSSVPAARPLPTLAVPYIAHVYDNDGVTFLRTLPPLLADPQIEYTVNSGSQDVKLQVAVNPTDETDLGHIVKLTEQGGDGSVIFSGFIEDLPQQISADGTVVWQLAVTSIAAELGRQQLTLDGSLGADIAVYAQAAVDLCPHLYYTPSSIPMTGIVGFYQFSQSTNVMDECRYMGGVDFFWYVDPEGLVYFQSVPSSATWTFNLGIDYPTKQSSASIVNRANIVNVTGGVPPGGSTPATAQYAGSSASPTQLGPRPLWPPVSVPNVTSVVTLQAIANCMGAIFDRTMHTITFDLPAYPERIMPGRGVRLFEPSGTPMLESWVGPSEGSNYIGPYVCLDVKRQGALQTVTIGDIPISTSTTDYQSIIDRISSNTSLAAILNTPASLTQASVMAANGAILSTPPNPAISQPPAGWYITKNSILAADGTANDYGAPSGEGVTFEVDGTTGNVFLGGQAPTITLDDSGVPVVQIGNLAANGISPAQTGIRVNNPNTGSPIFDTLGVIGAASLLTTDSGSGSGAGSGSGYSVIQTIPGSGATFTLTRQSNLLTISVIGVEMGAGAQNYCGLYHSLYIGGTPYSQRVIGQVGFTTNVHYYLTGVTAFIGVPAGTYTFHQQFALDAGTTLVTFGGYGGGTFPGSNAEVIQLGG